MGEVGWSPHARGPFCSSGQFDPQDLAASIARRLDINQKKLPTLIFYLGKGLVTYYGGVWDILNFLS